MKFPFERQYTVLSGHEDWKVSKISSLVFAFSNTFEGSLSSSGGFPIAFSKTANIFQQTFNNIQLFLRMEQLVHIQSWFLCFCPHAYLEKISLASLQESVGRDCACGSSKDYIRARRGVCCKRQALQQVIYYCPKKFCLALKVSITIFHSQISNSDKQKMILSRQRREEKKKLKLYVVIMELKRGKIVA